MPNGVCGGASGSGYPAVTGSLPLDRGGRLSVCGTMPGVDDAVAGYLGASESNDIDALMETLAPDAEVFSPLSGRMVFRGHDDLRVLLGAVYSTVREMRWNEKVGDGQAQIVVGTFKVGPLRASDAMAFDLDAQGRIGRIRPHLRPWLATTLFALFLGPKVIRHPGVIWRALRS